MSSMRASGWHLSWRLEGWQRVFAVGALVGVLAIGWVTDYRYVTQRIANGH
jgi:hypothetical protein